MKTPKPLDNFPLIRSRDIEEVREAIARVYAKPALLPARDTERVDAVFNNCRLQFIELAYGSYGAAVSIEFPPTGFFSLLFPICGSGEIVSGRTSVAVTAGAGTLIAADQAHQANFSADYEHLVLRINARLLTEKLANMIGTALNEPLRMRPQQGSKHPAAQMLQHYLPLLIDTLSGANPPFPSEWIEQTEQLLMTLFLCGYRHKYSHLLEQEAPDAAPWQVRQAEEYIEANAGRAITLEELAEVTGVNAFSLFRSFKKSRGYSPLEFPRRLRSKRGE